MRNILACIFFVFTGSALFAQTTTLFEKGSTVVNAGFGIPNIYWGSGSSGSPVSLNASFDYGMTDKIGIGYIGLGGTIGFTSTKYNYYNGGNKYNYSGDGVLIAFRPTYHFIQESSISDRLDPYAGLLWGYVITTSTAPKGYDRKGNSVVGGVFLGAHYYFDSSFGVYAEIGYNAISIFNTGLTFKLK